MKFLRNKKTFADLSRGRRSEMVIGVKNRIRSGNDLFWSTPEVGEKDQFNCIDLVFLSRTDRFTFYNVKCVTTMIDFWDKVEAAAIASASDDLVDIEEISKKIITKNPPVVRERFLKLNGYLYGVGLEMVIDAPFLTVDAINGAIHRFWDNGEEDWINPLNAVHVPNMTEREFYKSNNRN